MNELVAPIGNIRFNIERDLDDQIGAQSLPFPGMDKSASAVCVRYLRGNCDRALCPYKHWKTDRTVVCKHWLRGLCKKGDACEFLHQYDMTRMPICYFFSRYQSCTNKECAFLHIDPNSTIPECQWYERGFCRHGSNCRKKHTRRFPCFNYLCGFCPEGPACKFVHMSFDIPETKSQQQHQQYQAQDSNKPEHPSGLINANHGDNHHPPAQNSFNPMNREDGLRQVICNYCREPGHKIYTCRKIPADRKDEVVQNYIQTQQQKRLQQQKTGEGGPGGGFYKPLDQVTCFKCGVTGHFANKCPNGFNKNQQSQNPRFHNNNFNNFRANNNNPQESMDQS